MQAVKNLTTNRWIANLPARSRSLVLKAAKPQELALRDTVHEVAQISPSIYFPLTAVFSMIVCMTDGKTVEANMVGGEGFVPVASTLLPLSNTIKTIVQVGGEALAIDAGDFGDLVKTYSDIARLRERYSGCDLRLHHAKRGMQCSPFRARAQRTLAYGADGSHAVTRCQRDSPSACGDTGRKPATRYGILATLQNDGFLELQRATLRIVNAEGLRGAACECYGIIKREMDQFPTRRI